jgi:hypothetical protein
LAHGRGVATEADAEISRRAHEFARHSGRLVFATDNLRASPLPGPFPRARVKNPLAIHSLFYGALIFYCKTAQFSETPRK